MFTKEELGRRIAEARRKAGLTQEDLGTAVGLDRTAVTRIEQGRRGLDTLQMTAIADVLGREPAFFFEPAEEQPPEVLLRAPEAQREDIRQQLEWLIALVRDYEFLCQLMKGAVAP
ncbi:MAG: helix-turn-helix transcriptional regulator [Chloroflexi bacterium]|nr:helix-turn-helix transcriptional regulator [Chloroflexota bacterium]